MVAAKFKFAIATDRLGDRSDEVHKDTGEKDSCVDEEDVM